MKRLKPLAQHIGVRQPGLVRQDIPRREKEGRLGRSLGQGGEPCLQFLLKLLLKLAGGADDHHWPTLDGLSQNRRQEAPSALTDAAKGQQSALLRAFGKGLKSGSFS